MSHFKQLILLVMLTAIAASPASGGVLDVHDAGKIIVFEEAEDATSTFEYIYVFDDSGEITKITHIWNGGCCQPPIVEEFVRAMERFKLIRSYTFESRPENLLRAVICESTLKTVTIEPTHMAKAGLTTDSIEAHHLEEGEAFAGC